MNTAASNTAKVAHFIDGRLMKKRRSLPILLSLYFGLFFGANALGADDPRLLAGSADIVMLDAKVITVNATDALAEAIAIKGNRIVAVGRSANISRFIDPNTKVMRLNGKSILPGFIDVHTHVGGIASFHRMLDVHIPPLKDVDAILQKVRNRAGEIESGAWIVGAGGWGQALPNREQLDLAAPNNPVVLRESAHVQILNSMAMKIAGINKDTKAPVGGHIFRDQNGEPTGKIQEMGRVWQSHVPPATHEEIKTSLKEVMESFRSLGVTSIYDYTGGETMRIYRELRDEKQLPVRLQYQLGGPPPIL